MFGARTSRRPTRSTFTSNVSAVSACARPGTQSFDADQLDQRHVLPPILTLAPAPQTWVAPASRRISRRRTLPRGRPLPPQTRLPLPRR
eukprot:6731481-Prymnesium_polylepis.1